MLTIPEPLPSESVQQTLRQAVRYPRAEFEQWLTAERAADRRGGVKVSA